MTTPSDTPVRSVDSTLRYVLIAIALLVVVAVVAVVVRKEPPSLAADSPEGVVQRYATAVLDDDERAAGEYLSQSTLENCDPDYYARPADEDVRLTLISTEVRDDTADVRVRITTFSGSGPFGVSEWSSEEIFDLVLVDGEWRISAAPWMLTVCPEMEVGQ